MFTEDTLWLMGGVLLIVGLLLFLWCGKKDSNRKYEHDSHNEKLKDTP